MFGKRNYVKISLSAIEKECGKINNQTLQAVYHGGNDHQGYGYKLHVNDEGMENVNMWTKLLPMSADKNSWRIHLKI